MAASEVAYKALFPQFEQALIEEIGQKANINTVPAGSLLARKGQYFRYAWIVVEGLVKIYREDGEGNEFFIYYLEPGNACVQSMVCAAGQQTSEIVAIAVKDSTVLSIPLQVTDDWTTRFKSWNNFVLSSYRRRFEDLLTTLDQVAFRNMDERLEFYLKRQADKLGKQLPLTHQQIAADLNTSREVVSRLLKNMEKNKRIVLHRSSIEWIS
jgi:CRP/FNR family transcriptional regulator, anaerobic regulatory protein